VSKKDQYRIRLQELDSWDAYLAAESGLPGPRGNLELAAVVAEEGSEAEFLRFASIGSDEAPTNTPGEFLAFCGVLGLGYLVAKGQTEYLVAIRRHASDPRWRVREAAAMALQRYGLADISGLLTEMRVWLAGNLLERRAVVAALCEPVLLRSEPAATEVIDILDKITASILDHKDRRLDDFRVLRQGLAYGWSVAVAAQPPIGKPALEKWIRCDDADIRWIMRQNLKKNRLKKMDAAWVQAQTAILD